MDALGIAYGHFRAARKLRIADEPDAALAQLYYAAFFAARAALADLDIRSKKHSTWLSEFNRRFGRGSGWVSARYTRILNRLFVLREDVDYCGTGPNDPQLTHAMEKQVAHLLKLVKAKTPLLKYTEFLESVVLPRFQPDALEFDYYCPRSYFHKERLQVQLQTDGFTAGRVRKLQSVARTAVQALGASRQAEYVVGWNSRLGQDADKYLLLLDLDTSDLARLKQALKARRGWLFASGDGFHFVGADVLPSDKMWRLRLTQAGRSRQLKPFVDPRHVEFSLRRGYATLRITGSKAKPIEPFMCWDNS